MHDRTTCVAIWALAVLACCFGGDSNLPLGSSCATDSDCADPFVCQYGRCRSECEIDQECDEGTVCVPSESGEGRVCTLLDERDCSEGSCPGELVCDSSGMCRAPCDQGDCEDNEICVTLEPENGEAPLPFCVPGETQNLTITDDEDDGEIYEQGDPDPAYELHEQGEHGDGVLFMGRWWYTGAHETWSFFRFELSESIPAGATVHDAMIKLWGLGPCYIVDCWTDDLEECADMSEEVRELAIQATDESDPRAVTEPPLVPGAIDTTSAVSWFVEPEWANDEIVVSPNIASILQELVDAHGGLEAEHHVLLWIAGVNHEQCAEVRAADVSHSTQHGGSSQPAELQIIWQNPR